MSETGRQAPLILVVDDDATQRALLRRALEKNSFLVEEVADGAHVVHVVRRVMPDIVLLDVILPHVDGFTICAKLREDEWSKNIPIVMLTGLEDTNSIQRAYQAGATDFITKPVNWQILNQRLQYIQRASENTRNLVRSQARLADAQRISRLGSWEIDLAGTVTHISDETREVFRLAEEEPLTLETFSKSIHPEDLQLISDARDRALTVGDPYEIHYRLLWPDANVSFIHEQAEVQLDKEGKPTGIVGTIQDVSERRRLEQKLEHLAYNDLLTGLPNRRSFKAALEAALKPRDSLGAGAILYLDLDRFKRVNDTLGHSAGDELLRLVASRLTKCVRHNPTEDRGISRSEDMVARIGGDEFIILVSDIQNEKEASMVAERILKNVSFPFNINEAEIFVSFSIGLILFSEESDPEALLMKADNALYRAKDAGRNNYQFYTEDLDDRDQKRFEIENDLRHAIERGELGLFYQPLVSLNNHQITGVEALMRWNHPEHGMVLPGRFIPVAEETGLILPMGEWTLEEACAQAASWVEAEIGPLRLSVNLSARQFRDSDLVIKVANAIMGVGLDPSYLELELTESVLMEDTATSRTQLTNLKDLGVRIAIDDFGTGYSSLSYLKRFPLDRLKIDRSFVRDLIQDSTEASIVSAIIAMAHELRLEVVAEGVETQEQYDYLCAEGCDVVQGYLIAQPMPRHRFEAMWSDRKEAPPPQSEATDQFERSA
jgi:diguanylate cyclase (GGDEF)-like protein/PAS domain S-box-containing protein